MALRAEEEEEKYAAKESEGRCLLQNQMAMGPQGPRSHDTTRVPDRAPWTQPRQQSVAQLGSSSEFSSTTVTSEVSEAE